jgi:hypothetical protein
VGPRGESLKNKTTGDKIAGAPGMGGPGWALRMCPEIQSPALLEPGFSLTLFLQGEFDGRISFDGFATAKNFVIGY